MEEGLLSLRWNDHGQTFFRMLSSIRKNESFCDVTLACDGYFYPVHKFVLSTCSDFFYQMFEKTSCKHPVIVIANVGHKDLEALLNYMYLGEVNVLQTELTGLVKAAEILRIKGLAEHSKNSSSKETREKRTSLWETDQSEAKRRKNDDHSSVHRRQKESERVQHVKESTLRSRICDSDKHNHTNTENSETALDDTLDSVELSSGEMTNITKSDSVSAPKEHHLQDAVRPEVKIEEICVKEEPSGSWYHDDEKELDSYQYGDSEGGLGYEAHPTTFQENCSPWELAATQVQAMESQMTGIPGPSGIQGLQGEGEERRVEEATGKNPIGRRKKLTPDMRKTLIALAKNNQNISCIELREFFKRKMNMTVSARTIRRELNQAGFQNPRSHWHSSRNAAGLQPIANTSHPTEVSTRDTLGGGNIVPRVVPNPGNIGHRHQEILNASFSMQGNSLSAVDRNGQINSHANTDVNIHLDQHDFNIQRDHHSNSDVSLNHGPHSNSDFIMQYDPHSSTLTNVSQGNTNDPNQTV